MNDIPAGMQEALLQQALEKIVPVRRLELFAKTKHAQAELENQAVRPLALAGLMFRM